MSTTEPPEQPAGDRPTEQVPPAVPPLPPPPQPAAAAAPPPQYAYDPAWTAPARPRWIHPERRAAAAVIAVVSALALLFVGGVAGAAIAHHRDRVVDVRFPGAGRFEPDNPYGHNGPLRPFPRGPMQITPTPTPSKT